MDTKSNNDFLSDYIMSPIYTFSNNIGNSIGNTIDTIGSVPSMVTNNNVVSSIGQAATSLGEGFQETTSYVGEAVSSVGQAATSLGEVSNKLYETSLKTVRSENNIIMKIIDSIRGDWFRILIVAGILSLILFLVIAKDVIVKKEPTKEEKQKEKEKIEIQIREGLTNREKTNLLNSMKKGFCNTYSGKSDELDSQCQKLTENNCNLTECCVYTSVNKCVAGNKSGPTFKTDDNNQPINLDYYYYQNKCYGNCDIKK